jgi:hypothetical protein
MKIKIIKYGGETKIIECNSFEFRTNHVSNWIRIKYTDNSEELIHGICVIKSVEKENEEN